MRLLSLSLTNVRSYACAELDLTGNDVQIFIGPNGSGKTNILEAISILSQTKSCLGAEEADVLRFKHDFFRIRGKVTSDSGEPAVFEVVHQWAPQHQKACFVNDVRVSVAAIVGRLPTVVFLPQDLHLFIGPPSERRRFLDQILCQVHPEYYQALAEYQKILKQRNTLLRRIANGESSRKDLIPWNIAIAEKGGIITLYRLELIETFGLSLASEMEALGERQTEARFLYVRGIEQRERTAMQQELLERLRHIEERDVLLQSTTVGPHRDDWIVELKGKNAALFASRGEQRTAVLALLFLEVSYLGLRRGEKPVILLDDVFSELDDAHQEGVLNALADHQILITSTHVPKETRGACLRNIREAVKAPVV